MSEVVHDFIAWLRALPPGGIYAVLLAVAYGENLIPPIWGDTVIVLCGSLVGLGVLDFAPTVALSAIGGSLGFLTVFWVGRRLGSAIHNPNHLRWIPREPIHRAERWLARWGYGVVAANRFLAGGRAVIGLLAGASGLRWAPTAAWATVSSILWSLLLVWGGSVLGSEWGQVLAWLKTYGRIVTAALVVIVLVLFVRRRRRRRETEKETAKRASARAGQSPRG